MRPAIVKVRVRGGPALAHLVYEGWTLGPLAVCTFCNQIWDKHRLTAVRGTDPMPVCTKCNKGVGNMAKADIKRELKDGDFDELR